MFETFDITYYFFFWLFLSYSCLIVYVKSEDWNWGFELEPLDHGGSWAHDLDEFELNGTPYV